MTNCTNCKDTQAGAGQDSCPYLMAAYIFAGLAMMLNIRLSYSSAPYALIRFQLPENLFSVFVRRMASALELWCLPSMLLGNLMDYGLKGYYKHHGYTPDFNIGGGNLKDVNTTISITPGSSGKTITIKNLPHINDTFTPRQEKFFWIIIPSIISQWLNFLTYVILLFVYLMGGEKGYLTVFYFVIAISGVVFGINMVLLYAVDWNYIPVYIVGENTFPIVTSAMHYITTLIFGNRRRWNSDFLIVVIDIGVAIIISLVAAVLWSIAYGYYTDTQKEVTVYTEGGAAKVTFKDGKCAASAQVATATFSKDTTPGKATLKCPTKTEGPTLNITGVKPDSAGATLPDIPKDTPCNVNVDPKTGTTLTINYNDKCITITITAKEKAANTTTVTVPYGHIFTESFDTSPVHWQVISPTLMVIVGMGLVYAIYPGIAPGMIVPFYLVDKIEMVLLIATFFPPVIVATLQKVKETKAYSPKTVFAGVGIGMGGWKEYKYDPNFSGHKIPANASFYHAFDLLMVIKITLATVFIYSLHYRDSSISRAIVNQPKMSTILSIVFYMCHECLLALGFPGIIGNNGSTYVMLPAQYIGALFMIFLAFYSEGYIIEYKSHDPAHWPTTGMTKWNAFCYWCKDLVRLRILT